MESQSPSTHGHHYEEDPHNAGLHTEIEGEDDQHHHEKKSVLKKVKAKAKKIKNIITKHGHGHDHDQEHDDYDNDAEEGDDEDEEMVEDPEIHGSPIYESAAVRSAVRGSEANMGQPGVNLERPSVMSEDRYDSRRTDAPVRPFGQCKEEESEQPRGNLGGLMGKEEAHLPEDKHASFSPGNYGTGIRCPTGKNIHGQEENLGRQRGIIGMPTGMEEDPDGPKDRGVPSNVQAKATDPTGTGGEEAAGITPILHSFHKMGIYDEWEPKPKPVLEQKPYTGSHDQFAPEPLPHENPESVPKSYDASKPGELPRDTLTGNPSNQSSSYTEKISSDTSAIADTAKSAKNVFASKRGYGGNESTRPHEAMHGEGDAAKSASATDYAHKIAATVAGTLGPVYGKVAGAGSTVMSKVTGTGTGQEGAESKGGGSVEYWVDKLRPGEEDKALSEVITGTFSKSSKPKEETEKKRAEEQLTGEAMGKVTESEEVAKRLDKGGEEVGGDVGVVDRLKGVVGSWLGKGQTSRGTTYAGGKEGFSSSAAVGKDALGRDVLGEREGSSN